MPETIEVRVGKFPWSHSQEGFVYVGFYIGYFKGHGRDVKITEPTKKGFISGLRKLGNIRLDNCDRAELMKYSSSGLQLLTELELKHIRKEVSSLSR